jgi:hypothetical protein
VLAPLLALTLAAATGSRCEAIWSGIESGKDFKQDVLGNLLHNDASKVAVLRGHFLEHCGELGESEQSCGAAHPGRMLFRACPGLGQAFHLAATAPDVASAELTEIREEGLAREAVANLRQLGRAARQLRLQNGPKADFAFPSSTEKTPRTACCETASKLCAPNDADWKHPTWKALGFAPTGPFRFHYRFVSSGTGRQAAFVIQAVGDPECSGETETWELTGQSDGKQFVVGEPVRK